MARSRLGNDLPITWEAVLAGAAASVSSLALIHRFRTTIAAEVTDSPQGLFPPKEVPPYGYLRQYALVAAPRGVADAG
jgi:hypothetical protein